MLSTPNQEIMKSLGRMLAPPGFRGRMKLDIMDSYQADCHAFFKSPEEAQEPLDYAKSGVDNLQQYLAETYLSERPETWFRFPRDEKELKMQKLENVIEDTGFIAILLKYIGKVHRIKGTFSCGGVSGPFNRKIIVPEGISPKRAYFENIDPNGPSVVDKTPALIALYPGIPDVKINQYADLAHQTLINQLEPFTREKIDLIYKRAQDHVPSEVYSNLAHERGYEEKIIAAALVTDWLEQTKGQTGFSQDKINGWFGTGTNDKSHEQIALTQVRQKTPKRVVEFFADTKNWDFQRFLASDF